MSKDKSLFCAVPVFCSEPLFEHNVYLVYGEKILTQQTACNTKSTAHTLQTCKNNNNFGIEAKKFAVTGTLRLFVRYYIVGLHGCLKSAIILCCMTIRTRVS